MKGLQLPEKSKAHLLMMARLFIGALFIFSGYSKLSRPVEYFEVVINFYSVLPDNLAHIAAYVMPWIEFFFGTSLLLGYCVRISAGVLSVLTAIFQMALAQALIRKLLIEECGCFGNGLLHLSLYQSFTLDTIMLLILIQLAFSQKSEFSLDNWTDYNPPTAA